MWMATSILGPAPWAVRTPWIAALRSEPRFCQLVRCVVVLPLNVSLPPAGLEVVPHSMPLLISFPICTISGMTPASLNASNVFCVYDWTVDCNCANERLAQAAGLVWCPGSAHVSEY